MFTHTNIHTHKQHTYKHTPQKCVLQHLIRGHLTNHMIYYPQHIRRQGVREFNKTTYHYATYKHYRERTKKPCYTHNIPVPLLHNVETNKKCIVNEALIKTLCCIVVGVLHVHERLVRTFKQAMKASNHDQFSPQQRLENFLLSYRTTPHATTGESPCTLFLGRQLRTRLDLMLPSIQERVESLRLDKSRLNAPSSYGLLIVHMYDKTITMI